MEFQANEDIRKIVDEHQALFVDDMGFKEEEFKHAVREIRQRGGLKL